VDKLVKAIESHRSDARSPQQARARARNQVRRALSDAAWRSAEARHDWEATVESVADRTLDPITAAERLLDARD
jgi:putative protein kinase ArgK-like GTPase of G3E family